jgi:hypothetical protein
VAWLTRSSSWHQMAQQSSKTINNLNIFLITICVNSKLNLLKTKHSSDLWRIMKIYFIWITQKERFDGSGCLFGSSFFYLLCSVVIAVLHRAFWIKFEGDNDGVSRILWNAFWCGRSKGIFNEKLAKKPVQSPWFHFHKLDDFTLIY